VARLDRTTLQQTTTPTHFRWHTGPRVLCATVSTLLRWHGLHSQCATALQFAHGPAHHRTNSYPRLARGSARHRTSCIMVLQGSASHQTSGFKLAHRSACHRTSLLMMHTDLHNSVPSHCRLSRARRGFANRHIAALRWRTDRQATTPTRIRVAHGFARHHASRFTVACGTCGTTPGKLRYLADPQATAPAHLNSVVDLCATMPGHLQVARRCASHRTSCLKVAHGSASYRTSSLKIGLRVLERSHWPT